MYIPISYGAASLALKNAILQRTAFITWGVRNPEILDLDVATSLVWSTTQGSGTLQGIFDTGVTMGPLTVRWGTADPNEQDVRVSAATSLGLASMTSLPPNVAVLVRKNTSRGGRKGRGRFFLPWAISEANVDEAGVITGSDITAMNTKLSAWRTDADTNDVPMAILHKNAPDVDGDPNLIVTLIAQNLVATQRRRLGR